MITSIRRPRSDSVGPQSTADAYEALAYQRRTRRASNEKMNGPRSQVIGGDNEKALRAEEEAEQERREEAEIMMQIEKPRVRYDVEVITKLFVYSGKIITIPLSNCSIANQTITNRHCVDCS